MHALSGPDGAPLATRVAADLFTNLTSIVRGKPAQIRLAIAVLLAGGHLLIEDIPGVGKTVLAKSLARSVGGTFRRIQGTPDLLPADLTGVSIYKRSTETWQFRPGPLFANVVLVDEINRATPRTQAALLEAMAERQVSVDGATYRLPEPFFLIATQNPFEHAGTFPLVEGQLDRFSAVLELGLPGRDAEREIMLGYGGAAHLDEVEPVVTAEVLSEAARQVADLHCDAAVADYVLDLTEASRHHPEVTLGASPRASLGLLAVARAAAAVRGARYVSPDDVKNVAAAVLAHRLVLSGGTDLRASRSIVEDIVRTVAVPRT
ncbi:MAG: AAA family ATPase [Acidimicrobiia bacterium]|nr:AAA family ATPase [Acidimicrobiia bacterium]